MKKENSDDDYIKYRGKCKEYCEALIAKDPTLKIKRGYYYDPVWEDQQHWWCVDSKGNIIDPTKDQFPSKGTGIYTECDGTFNCSDCLLYCLCSSFSWIMSKLL